jgi:hypothetical protein
MTSACVVDIGDTKISIACVEEVKNRTCLW